jgi:hypothetical protein
MCYYLKTQYYNEPLFKNVDATYIIHLQGNEERHKNITDQLEMYQPTKIVHIVYNKGYKNCNKDKIQDTVQDLIDTYLYIMNDAKQYDTILILEDDFMFHKDIKEHTHNIDTFIQNNTDYIYRLGCIPIIQLPYNMYTYIGLSLATHSVLYSKSIRNKILENKIGDWNKIVDWDVYINFVSVNYIYYKPLCYQLFPNTENRNNWGNFNKFIHYIAQLFIVTFIKLMGIDTHAEPGYSILYTISKLLSLLIVLFILKIFNNKFSIFKYKK